jgi:hypothetical protein
MVTFFRTLKEQIVHGRIHQTIDDVRHAVRTFITRYNLRTEGNGHSSFRVPRSAGSLGYL